MQRTFRKSAADSSPADGWRPQRAAWSDESELTWDQVLAFPRVLMVAEAGAGKTHECRARAEALFEKGEAAFFVRLESVAKNGVAAALRGTRRKRFNKWRKSAGQTAYFFLDSIDELQLSHFTFRDALERLAEDLEGVLGLATIVITSRPVAIDRRAFSEFLPVPERIQRSPDGNEFVRIVTRQPGADGEPKAPVELLEVSLSPLTDKQIVEFARERNVPRPDELLRAIRVRNAQDFVRAPQELLELFDDWRDHREIRPHFDQIKSHIRARLAERHDRVEKAQLSIKKAREGAQRLALAVVLSRRWTFRHSARADVPGSGEEPIDPTVLLEGWKSRAIATLLERPLFGEGGYGRVRFHHRSILEFLAARQIDDQINGGTLSVSAANRLLLALTDANERVVKPSMRPVAAWLALLRTDVFETILSLEPSTLLIHGDPESLQPLQCQRALAAFVERYGKGQWRGLQVPQLQLARLAKQRLGDQILRLWETGVENPEVRKLLLELISVGQYQECADLAVSVAADAAASNIERFEALRALTTFSDTRAAGLISSAVSLAAGWPHTLARMVGNHLYPEYVTDSQVLNLLSTLRRESLRGSDFGDSIAGVIKHADMSVDRLRGLMPEVAKLAVQSLIPVDLASPGRNDHNNHAGVLRQICIRLLKADPSIPGLPETAALAFRLAESAHDYDKSSAKLAELLSALPASTRQRVFHADCQWAASLHSRNEPQAVWGRVVFNGALRYTPERDQRWALKALSKRDEPLARRQMLLRLALRLGSDAEGKVATQKQIRKAVKDSKELVNQLDDLLAAMAPNPDILRMLEKQRKRQEKADREAQEEKRLWLEFWHFLAERPKEALSPKNRERTIWNSWSALSQRSSNGNDARWDRAFLKAHFDVKVVDRLRRSLMLFWRDQRPSVRSERPDGEKDTYLVAWSIGLMGIYAEAEDPGWVQRLSPQEAELAARYALIEASGLPDWLMVLSARYPDVVERVLGQEIEEGLSEPGGRTGWHSMVLQSIRYGRREIAKLLEPRLLNWLRSTRVPSYKAERAAFKLKVSRVIDVLLAHGGSSVHAWIAELATRHLKPKKEAAIGFWVHILCRTNASRGLAVLLRTLATMPVAKDGGAVAVIGRVFSDVRSDPSSIWSRTLSPAEGLSLVRVMERYIRREDDLNHEGAYSPGARDNAQDGRRVAFEELMATSGPDALEAKMTLASDPAFAVWADRIAFLAKERLAAEFDVTVFEQEELAVLLEGGESIPKTGIDMAHILVDRLDDLQELMLRDTAPRAAWAMVDDENALRPAIAHELEMTSKGSYTVDQEAVTVDGKETDIRLRATSGLQATIELKLAEKGRSGAELRRTIDEQLVRKYMAPKKARAGCLLVSVSEAGQTWRHPDSRATLDMAGLQTMLSEAAQAAQVRLGGEARVLARVLDLTPRLKTEAGAAEEQKRLRRA